MRIQVSGRQIDVGDALRHHINESLETLVRKYFPDGLDAQVAVGRENHLFRIDCSLHVAHGLHLRAGAQAEEATAAFGRVAEKLEKQLRRHKRRLKDRHLAGRFGQAEQERLLARSYVLAKRATEPAEDDTRDGGTGSGTDDSPVIIAESGTQIPAVTVGDAVMMMNLADQPALMFRNRGNGQLNLVYRRQDGHVGWVAPAADDGDAAR